MSKQQKRWAIGIFLLLLVAISVLYVFLVKEEQKNIFNLATLIGTYVSAYGFIVALIQIHVLQSITQSTQKAVTETKTKIQHILSISDLSKAVAILHAIQEDIHSDKFELAKSKLHIIKDIMSKINYIDEIDFDKNDFIQLSLRIKIDLGNLDKQMTEKRKIDKVNFCQNMEDIASMLSNLENQIKYQNNYGKEV